MMYIAALALACAWSADGSTALADGGSLRLSEVHDPWRVYVFTSPTPSRIGVNEIAVLVQDERSGVVRQDLDVRVTARSLESGAELVEQASNSVATNKLYKAAHCDLPSAGRWQFSVAIADRVGETRVVEFDCDVIKATTRSSTAFVWVGWTVVPIAVFGIHRRLVWQRREILFKKSRHTSTLTPNSGVAVVSKH